jgi:hypothetical protein
LIDRTAGMVQFVVGIGRAGRHAFQRITREAAKRKRRKQRPELGDRKQKRVGPPPFSCREIHE